MFEDLTSAYGGRLVIAVIGVGIGLLVLVGVLWVIRRRNGPSPFVRGGKNRQPRLQVLDAAAVDTRRRLVLIRRDNVEHLVMIGGPTDIVIESGISAVSAGIAAVPQATPRFVPQEAEAPMAAASVMEARAMMEPRPAPVMEPRPAPAPRPAPPAPEPRFEQAREAAPVPRETPRPPPVVTPPPPPVAAALVPLSAPPPPRPLPPAAMVAAEPMPVPRAEAPQRPAPEVKPEPLRPIAALAAAVSSAPAVSAAPPVSVAPAASTPAIDNAADLLDAARGRVFQETPEPRVVPVTPATVPPALQQAAERPKQLGSDFERILEQEMANNLAAGQAPVIAQPTRQTPPRDPSVPPVTGATREPSLQSEVARIFGEMSVTRDK